MGKQSMEKGVKFAKELTEELLSKLGVKAEINTSEQDAAIHIGVEGEDLGILIGYHGENLEAVQLILGLMINKKLGGEEWVPVSLDVGGWRKERSEALRSMIDKAEVELKENKESVELPPMSASQRRMVHVLLSDYKGLTSESAGEEPNRRVIIKKE